MNSVTKYYERTKNASMEFRRNSPKSMVGEDNGNEKCREAIIGAFRRKRKKMTTIFGIDPGTNVMGIAVIHDNPRLEILHLKAISLGKKPRPERLAQISNTICMYLDVYAPDILAIEDQYVGINKRGSLRLAGAKDVCITEATKRGIPIKEYAPSTVKKAVTGYGDAPKSMVATFVSAICKINLTGLKNDATDALAVAICHSQKAKAQTMIEIAWR